MNIFASRSTFCFSYVVSTPFTSVITYIRNVVEIQLLYLQIYHGCLGRKEGERQVSKELCVCFDSKDLLCSSQKSSLCLIGAN